MDHLLTGLDASHRVLDLGCGGGSFDYARYTCRITGLDFSFPHDAVFESRRALSHVSFIRALSHRMPFADGTFDTIICNNTLEHFEDLDSALSEIQRVTHARSRLYIAVPNGYGFDDGLYRFMLRGGGHLNRFSFDSLRSRVEGATRFRLRSFRRLYSSFIYLNRPRKEILIYLPRRMRWYYRLGPQWLVRPGMFLLNQAVRWSDALFRTNASQYGWAFYFQTESGPVEEQPGNVNVCMNCGAGHPVAQLRAQGAVTWRWPGFYRCPNCRDLNLLFR